MVTGPRHEPVVNLSSGQVLYNEVLFPLDIAAATGKSVQGFFDEAERTGLSPWVDRSVLEYALDALEDAPTDCLGVNISYRTLVTMGPALVRAIARRRPAVRSRLIVEITEIGEAQDWNIHDVLVQIRRLQVRIAIDDFGAGLHNRLVPELLGSSIVPDLIKLDGHLVKEGSSSQGAERHLRALLRTCRGTGAMIVAEHVESRALLQFVCELGLNFAQGRLISAHI